MGRPKADISAAQVRKLASLGTKNTEIAEFFGVSADTIERRFAGDLLKGKANLRKGLRTAQIKAAERGNSAMLVWLGKQYLGQSDTTIDEYLSDAIQTAGLSKDDLLELIKNKDKVNTEKTKKSFEEFCEAAHYPKPYPKQVDMMKFGMEETVNRLLLGSRGYGKTDYVVILGIAYQLYLDAQETNLIITKSQTRNAAMLREIEGACMANGMMFSISNSTDLRVMGAHGKDHSVSSVTIKTVTLRGRHPKRVIMDDPVTEDDASEATRTYAQRKYNEVNKLCSNVLIIGQPAHKYDLYANLRDKVKTMEVPHGTIPELDHDLEAQRLAGVDEASISASYFLKVLSESDSPFDKVNYIDNFPSGGSAVAFIDPSFKGGDYTALSIAKQHMQGIAAVGFVWKKAWNHCLDDMLPHLKQFGVRKLAIEVNSLGDMPLDMLRQLFGGAIGVVGVNSNTNKHSRIMAAGSYAHLIHLSKESDKVYLSQVVQYEYKAKFDDAPDSLASLLKWIGLIRGKM